jgi:hypothetical protein
MENSNLEMKIFLSGIDVKTTQSQEYLYIQVI